MTEQESKQLIPDKKERQVYTDFRNSFNPNDMGFDNPDTMLNDGTEGIDGD